MRSRYTRQDHLGRKWDNTDDIKLYHGTQNATQFEAYKVFISEILYFIFLDYG